MLFCQDYVSKSASASYIDELSSLLTSNAGSTLNEHENEKLTNIEDVTTTSLSDQLDFTLQIETKMSPSLFQQWAIKERPLYYRRTPLRTVQIHIKEANKQLGKDLKKLNFLRKEKGYGKATAEGFAQLGISRLYQIAEHHEFLLWLFTEENILKNNPQRKERCISLLEYLQPRNIESNKDLIELVNSTRPKAITDQKV